MSYMSVPSAPTNVTITQKDINSAGVTGYNTITWTASVTDPSYPVLSYRIDGYLTSSSRNAIPFETYNNIVTVNGGIRSVTFDANPGKHSFNTTVIYTVTAINDIGPSAASPTREVETNCFLAGTPVLTPDGYKPIESLKRGDLVMTADARAVPIVFALCQEVKNATRTEAPYLIPASSLGTNLPCNDVVLSPKHLLQVAEDRWIPAWQCKTRSSKVRQILVGESFNYYNLVLPNYFKDNLVVSDGVVVESMNVRNLEFDETKNAYKRVPFSR